MAAEIDIAIFENITFHPKHPNFAETIYKKSGQIHQKHTHDQWCSAARVSMSKCTNPCYMTHRVLKARMNYCINQNRPKKKPPSQTPKPPNATGCPPLVFKGFKMLRGCIKIPSLRCTPLSSYNFKPSARQSIA